MIIISLLGGLGNQLFQYALGRRMHLLENKEVEFDLTFLKINKPGNTRRNLELQHFKLAYLKTSNFAFIKNLLLSLIAKAKPLLKEQNAYQFNSEILKIDTAFLLGYWQSYKYFEPIKKHLQDEFVPKKLRGDFGKNKESDKNNKFNCHSCKAWRLFKQR